MLRRVAFVASVAVACAGSETVVPARDAAPEAVADVAEDVVPECPAGTSRCGDTCADLASNDAHCGVCGMACGPAMRCSAARCVSRCTAGERICGGACADIATDNAHCGACDSPCADDEECVGGSCVIRCPTGQTACGPMCRNLSTDRMHCGACGNLCALGQQCIDGACTLVCGEGRVNCGGRCVDTQADDEHCGACEARCAADTHCAAGVCRGSACGPMDTAGGRCEGNVRVRCVSGTVARETCAFGEVCQETAGAAACAAPTGPRRVTGRITFQNRPSGPGGVMSTRVDPAPGVPVELLDADGRVLVQGVTGDDGAYSLGHAAPEGAPLRVRAVLARTDGPYNFRVRDYAGATFSFTTQPVASGAAVTRDLALTFEGNSGAVHIFTVVRRGFDFMRPWVTGRPAALYVTWQRGRQTNTNNSSYFNGASSTIFLNGSDTDPDEFDPAVIAHEFGHYAQRWYSRTNNPGGPHDGRPADPNLAFGEGGATFLASLITGSRYYIDAGVTRLRLLMDIQGVPLQRWYVADNTMPLSQPVSEWLVAGAQYTMFRASTDVDQQTRRAMSVLTGYLRRSPFPDRGEPGVDLVEYLDGYLCVNNGAERATIQSWLVGQRRFPYDFAYAQVCR